MRKNYTYLFCFLFLVVASSCKKEQMINKVAGNIESIDKSVADNSLIITITQTPNYYTPLLDTIFVAGTFNNWNAGDVNYTLQKTVLNTWQITLSEPAGTAIEYKFTRGNWSAVETKADGSYLPNRQYTFTNSSGSRNIAIGNWEDMLGNHTAVGNTKIIDLDFYMPQLNRYRRVWIYLPQDYYSSSAQYPTLYMQDGQNLFDYLTSFAGEWKCDETMETLQNSDSTNGIIIIGIDNGGITRTNEYSPWINPSYGGGEGDEYMSFIISTLKPFIDANFRTLPDRVNTGIMGSSMGGLLSWYGALANQNVFGKVGVFSPSFWFSPEVMNFAAATAKQYPTSFYFLAGGLEGSETDANIKKVIKRMK
ncbi:MAG TPA: alpha/beta hydrolase-fold protein, partial [Chitinophagaceae bacterium]|nr:alpha/beta hydrolase-fold protein [Chitinophagaceae bacterium]